MKPFILLSFLVLFTINIEAQKYDATLANRQEVYLQLIRPFYLSGEKLWFTLFNYNSDGGLLSGERFMKMTLIDRNGAIILSEYIKVEDGRTAGQFILPSELTTDEYLIHIGFPKESTDQFLYREKIKIYNRNEVLSSSENTSISFAKEISVNTDVKSDFLTVSLNENFIRKQKIDLDLKLETSKMASLSMLVQPAQTKKSNNILTPKQGYRQQNLRKFKSLDFQLSWEHPYLLLDLKPETPLTPEARAYIFIPETHQVKAFYRINEDYFSVDVSNVSGGLRSFYFNQFLYKAFIPAKADWDYEKAKYKDNIVPYFEGEMNFSWQETKRDFASVLSDVNFKKPSITQEVIKHAQQQSILEAMLATGGYEAMNTSQNEERENIMLAPTLFYRKASDYDKMDNMAEFLYEIVTGIRVWNNERRKEVRVLLGGEMLQDSPLFLVNGFPTRDSEKVLALPIESVQGAGVIKYQVNRAMGDFNDEARMYNAFSSSGIVVIHLKPGESNPFKFEYDNLLKKHLYIEEEAYPNPVYSTHSLTEDTPDLRKILLWEPIYEMSKPKETFSFYASDIPGTYELLIQGITDRGERIYVKKFFTVEGGFE